MFNDIHRHVGFDKVNQINEK